MIGRAATSAARRVCSLLAPASKSVPSRPTNCSFKRHGSMDPDLNQFYKRFSIIRDGDVKKTFSISSIPTGDAFVKYTAFGSLQASSKMEVELSHNDKPIFFLSCSLACGFHFTPISLEDDGSLSPKHSIYAPFRSMTLFDERYNFNGVFCLQQKDDMFVWNPITSEVRKLPDSPHTFNVEGVSADGFEKHNIFIGSWADPKSEDYKVINIITYENDDEESDLYPTEIELYSLKTDSWKKICWEEDFWTWGRRSCYINGVIYLTPYSQNSGQIILCFDFPTETLSTLPLPDFGGVISFELVKYNGQLSVFSWTRKQNHIGEMVHWVMRNGEWVREGGYHICGVDRPLGFARNDELLLFERYTLFRTCCELMVFDSTTGELKYVPGCKSEGELLLFEYDESFVKLKPSGEQEKEDGRTIEAQVA